ncbi:transglutaminase family protein [Lentzea tibetensis]|uniref:Transglutaminase family protein n=1 Tax=Lentzea tibetensis TaxID=2591470 RepID=A0A563EMX3_9PSEU|nr:transglutaminase family protein [Lentzea tibetensis]
MLAQPLLDHRALDLNAAERVTYVLEQEFHYGYDEPIGALRHRLVVVPRERHGDQHRRAHRVAASGAQVRRRSRRDAHGNVVVQMRADRVEEGVRFSVAALLERVRADGPTVLAATALRDPRLLRPTRLTAPDDRLRDLAADLLRAGGTPLELAERICHVVHEAVRYEHDVTSVETTAAEALAGGRGVCQDSAHVMIALCRLAGVPARYVSGHLLGEGGTHGWVEVVVASGDAAVAVPFDPCNDRRAGAQYITVATGRDYADVPPTSGSYLGTPNSTLTTSRRVGVLEAA